MPRRERHTIAKNRSAHHEYFIDETFEAGIALTGTEVRSLRERAALRRMPVSSPIPFGTSSSVDASPATLGPASSSAPAASRRASASR